MLNLMELLGQLAWVVELLHRRGGGGDAGALKQRGKQARIRCWRGRSGACARVSG